MRTLLFLVADALRTLPARVRARRAGVAFTRCPVCRRSFSSATVMFSGDARGPACLMMSPGGGPLVCARCQDVARTRNRDRWGRDLSDPYPPGVRL